MPVSVLPSLDMGFQAKSQQGDVEGDRLPFVAIGDVDLIGFQAGPEHTCGLLAWGYVPLAAPFPPFNTVQQDAGSINGFHVSGMKVAVLALSMRFRCKGIGPS